MNPPTPPRVGERHALITGASSGIGAAAARALAADGWIVHACARREERLRAVVGENGFTYRCDVGDAADVAAMAAAVASRTPALDALVTAAGSFGAIGAIGTVDPDAWLNGLRVNLFGTYLCVHHLLPLLKAALDPRIVNFSGGGAFNAVPNYSSYAVSKAGVVRLTENLAAELAHLGIRVNAMAPGFVATEIHEATLAAGEDAAGALYAETRAKMERGAIPMEIPVACLRYLLSDACRLTGKTISASFDPWRSGLFEAHEQALNAGDLYTMRRMNAVNLPGDEVAAAIVKAPRAG